MDCRDSKFNGTVFGIYMIGLPIYGIRRRGIGNLSGRLTILSLKPNCLRWRQSAMRSPITSKITLRAGKAIRRAARFQSCHEEGPPTETALLFGVGLRSHFLPEQLRG
jgi:hypothetical protein